MRRTKEEAEITKQNLLSAALEVFSRKGYTATRVEDVARQANLSTGAIYHHFGGKSDLYIALVEKNSAKANRLAQQSIEEGGSPATTLTRLLVRMFQFAEEDSEYRAVIELSLNKTEAVSDLASINAQILESRRQLARFLSGLISEGIRIGEFRSSIATEDAALALVGYINGLWLIWIQDQGYFSIRERAENFVNLFMAGLLVR